MSFTEQDWNRLATLFEPQCPDALLGMTPCKAQQCAKRLYAGYRPAVVEAPNGDTKVCPRAAWHDGPNYTCDECKGAGRVPNVDAAGVCGCCGGAGRLDTPVYPGDFATACCACAGTGRTPGKRYLHVGAKDLAKHPGLEWPREYHDRAFAEACRVATALGVPAQYRPHEAFGALRVLDYPPGAGTVEHTDFDLFTIVLWRSTPGDLERIASARQHAKGCPQYDDSGHLHHLAACGIPCTCAWGLSPGLHIGEIGELVGLGPATPHRVPARPYAQKSIIYFAIPDHAARLPCCGRGLDGEPCVGCGGRGQTAGEWLAERMARSRYEASK